MNVSGRHHMIEDIFVLNMGSPESFRLHFAIFPLLKPIKTNFCYVFMCHLTKWLNIHGPLYYWSWHTYWMNWDISQALSMSLIYVIEASGLSKVCYIFYITLVILWESPWLCVTPVLHLSDAIRKTLFCNNVSSEIKPTNTLPMTILAFKINLLKCEITK